MMEHLPTGRLRAPDATPDELAQRCGYSRFAPMAATGSLVDGAVGAVIGAAAGAVSPSDVIVCVTCGKRFRRVSRNTPFKLTHHPGVPQPDLSPNLASDQLHARAPHRRVFGAVRLDQLAELVATHG